MWNAVSWQPPSVTPGPGAAETTMLMSLGGSEAGLGSPLCLRAYLGIPISHELIQIAQSDVWIGHTSVPKDDK